MQEGTAIGSYIAFLSISFLAIVAEACYEAVTYKPQDSVSAFVHCAYDDGSVAWDGNARDVQYNKGKWSFYAEETNARVSTSADCTIKNSSK